MTLPLKVWLLSCVRWLIDSHLTNEIHFFLNIFPALGIWGNGPKIWQFWFIHCFQDNFVCIFPKHHEYILISCIYLKKKLMLLVGNGILCNYFYFVVSLRINKYYEYGKDFCFAILTLLWLFKNSIHRKNKNSI